MKVNGRKLKVSHIKGHIPEKRGVLPGPANWKIYKNEHGWYVFIQGQGALFGSTLRVNVTDSPTEGVDWRLTVEAYDDAGALQSTWNKAANLPAGLVSSVIQALEAFLWKECVACVRG